jgi:hypothetical protein
VVLTYHSLLLEYLKKWNRFPWGTDQLMVRLFWWMGGGVSDREDGFPTTSEQLMDGFPKGRGSS